MKNLGTSTLILATLILSARVAAAAEKHEGWSLNLTPVLIFPSGEDRFGGGLDPELKYTVDLGDARLSVGGRVGAYYARNLFGVTVMPTLRVMVPLGHFEPYVAVGLGYGWLETGQDGVATMGRLGFVYRFSDRFAIGVEGTTQRLEGSRYTFPSFGSIMSFDL
jgi:hypothetical protein